MNTFQTWLYIMSAKLAAYTIMQQTKRMIKEGATGKTETMEQVFQERFEYDFGEMVFDYAQVEVTTN